jgi:hypothetical protein
VFHYLVVKNNIEVTIRERNSIVHLSDATSVNQVRRYGTTVAAALIEDITTVRVDSLGKEQFDDLPLTTSIIEDATTMFGGKVRAEFIVAYSATHRHR